MPHVNEQKPWKVCIFLVNAEHRSGRRFHLNRARNEFPRSFITINVGERVNTSVAFRPCYFDSGALQL